MVSTAPLKPEKTSTNNVRILTLNCWGLMLVSRKRKERIRAIAKRLEECRDYDIIALQEIWVESDYELLKHSVQGYLPFAKRWYSGILTGPGLAVFSRWPIASAWIYRFPLNGRPSAFWRGDWYVGKAAGSCVIVHPSGRRLEVINAHLHAPYAPTGDAAYECHRAAQAWDLSGIVRRSAKGGHTTFVTGDLNTRPQSVGLKLLQYSHLSDAWIDSHGYREYSVNEIANFTPEEQICFAGVTSDSQLNTWRANYAINRAKRLDYIFYDPETATPLSSRVAFIEPEPNVGSLSDHFAFEAEFTLTEDSKNPNFEPHIPNTLNLSPKVRHCNHFPDIPKLAPMPLMQSVESLTYPQESPSAARGNRQNTPPVDLNTGAPMGPLSPNQLSNPVLQPAMNASTYSYNDEEGLRRLHDEILEIIEDYKSTCSSQSFWRLAHFWASATVVIGLLVAVWWGAAKNRSYVGFVFMIVSLIIAITGVLNGLIGFLFGRGECRALKEFEEQVYLSLLNLGSLY